MHTILIVDDQPLVRTSLARAARDWGLEACEAASGSHALAILANVPITIAVIDYHLADGMRGDELLAAIRGRYVHLPVIVYSASLINPSVRQALRALGATGLVSKPHFQQLAGLIRRCLLANDTN